MDKQVVFLPCGNHSPIVSVASSAALDDGKKALGITYADSGLALDITRNLEIWVLVQWKEKNLEGDCVADHWLEIVPGFGVGKEELTGDICLSGFARKLLDCNLHHLVPAGHVLRVEIIFPAGKDLAKRTSNEAFGVVDGLALIGTQAEAQVSASPNQLQNNLDELRAKSFDSGFSGDLIFVIGENGFDLAVKLGSSPQKILKVGNWVGPLLVAAAEMGVKKLLLLGYHGKLVKLAGGIFHTHHHLADGRLEVLIAIAVAEEIPLDVIKYIRQASSVEEALLSLEQVDCEFVRRIWQKVSLEAERRSLGYVQHFGSWSIEIGVALFDRKRRIRWAGPCGCKHLEDLDVVLET